MRKKHDWAKLADGLRDGAPYRNEYVVARELSLHRGTVRHAFLRGDLPTDLLENYMPPTPAKPKDEIGSMSLKEKGNEAVLKYNAAEPLSAVEVMEIAGINKKEWRVVDKEITMWQMGRKHKKVSLRWTAGKADGFVEDDGTIAKTYLYRIEVKLTRINRVAVKPVLRPINFSVLSSPIHVDHDDDGLKVLFIADPHFGFRRTRKGLKPIHSRPFINGLLSIADIVKPNVTVWNGDVLDLAEFGSFDTEPELLNNTQMAGLELGWILASFKRHSLRQVVIEGNHEIRLQKAIIKNLSSGYQLTPIHDLEGWPLLSVPRFLGLDSLDTEWIGDYPSGKLKIGSAVFQHGSIVRKGSGKTIGAMIHELTRDRFFGHIHRYEMAQKYVEDEGRSIWVGSPGCACDKLVTPGSNESHNWQLGAFLIHFDKHSGNVNSVEHISAAKDSGALFRGHKFAPAPYTREFRESLPTQYADWFTESF